MNPRIQQQWVDALRSGRYPINAKHPVLRTGRRFCGLGVLADLWIREDPYHRQWDKANARDLSINQTRQRYTPYTVAGEISILPQAVVEWAGLRGPNPLFDLGRRVLLNFAGPETQVACVPQMMNRVIVNWEPLYSLLEGAREIRNV